MNIYLIFTIIILLFVSILLLPICAIESIPKNQKLIFSFIIVIFFLSGGLFLYNQLGTPEILPLMLERENKIAILKEKISINSVAIQKDAKNLEAWIEIGDSFMQTNQFSAAVNAYKQSILLSEGNPILIMAYVRALIMTAGGTVTDEAKKGLDMVLILQPKNEDARYFLALQKLQSGDTQTAMIEMKELYKSLADDSPIKDMIDRQIGKK